jgi:hypothetical protein
MIYIPAVQAILIFFIYVSVVFWGEFYVTPVEIYIKSVNCFICDT